MLARNRPAGGASARSPVGARGEELNTPQPRRQARDGRGGGGMASGRWVLDPARFNPTEGARANWLRCGHASAAALLAAPGDNWRTGSSAWAFLAVEQGKVVFTACSPLRRWVLRSLVAGATVACFGILLGFLVVPQLDDVVLLMPLMLVVFSLLISKRLALSFVVNLAGLWMSSFMAVVYGLNDVREHWIASIGTFLYFVANECDRIRCFRSREEAKELVPGYAGVAGADSSSIEDKQKILEAIGTEQDSVDKSIRVLIDSGMSTQGLRLAAIRGVDVSGAADVRLGHFAVGVFLWTFAIYVDIGQSNLELGSFLTLGPILESVCNWLCAESDHKAFMGFAIIKVMLVAFAILALGSENTSQDGYLAMNPRYRAIIQIASCALVILGTLGRGGMVRMPCLGPWLVQALGPGFRCWCPRTRARGREGGAAEGDLEAAAAAQAPPMAMPSEASVEAM